LVVSGTSVGSLIGAMYARGLGWREIEGVLAAGGMSDFKTLLMSRVSGQGIVGVIDKMLDGMEFSDLKKPFAAVAVELKSGRERAFTEGRLCECLGASCAILPYFLPVEVDGIRCVDGAYSNIVPCDAAKALGADFVVGVDLSMGRQNIDSGKRVLDEAYPENGIVPCNPTAKGYAACDVMIAPDMTDYSSLSFNALHEMFDTGYFTTREMMPEIKKKLKKAGYKF